MHHDPLPVIGDWYRNDTGDTFEIIAQDEDDDTLELQYFDGTLEELDRETWDAMHAQHVEPPEDWRGSMDVGREDEGELAIWLDKDDWMATIDRLEDDSPG